MKILLIQLKSNGDCLMATTVARQIKEVDFPGCHLTWLINPKFRQAIDNNPYIDAVIEVDAEREAIPELIKRYGRGMDHVFCTNHAGSNEHLYFGTTRSSIFRAYGKPITVPIEPVLILRQDEKERVRRFAEQHDLSPKKPGQFNILCECSPQSRQSTMTPAIARDIAGELCKRHPGLKIVLSAKEPAPNPTADIIDGSTLSWRENAELTTYCDLLIGCSSGITWLNTASAGGKIPMLQLLRPQLDYDEGVLSASVAEDVVHNDLPLDDLIELRTWTATAVVALVGGIVHNGFAKARERYYGAFPANEALLRTIMKQNVVTRQFTRATHIHDENMDFMLSNLRFAFLTKVLAWKVLKALGVKPRQH